ncbi:unnamed protein product [Psylliodes chrysocephalus]|uniref:Phorbol-ester/DAG-type domain-containing protein n=1 Tax=Psylliodes chrysocephalus TaxID=3402493 RepID=A0A9P0CQX7_9CUCU|nr:unnamed protein product [Psylliodes chrysocephala]
MALLEARPFRPFKSSEEYLYAMKEDLAEWLQTMYPHLNIAMENFMAKLETGVALCERCKNPAKSGLRCVTCGTISHNSCVPGLKNIVYIDNESINCCIDNNDLPKIPSVVEHSTENINEVKIKFLEQLLQQKDLVISNQEIAIKALQGQINLLTEDIVSLKSTAPLRNDNRNTFQESSIPTISEGIKNVPIANLKDIQGYANTTKKSVHTFITSDISSAVHQADAANEIIKVSMFF